MSIPIIDCVTIPESASARDVYRLVPQADSVYYRERIDRNLGWIDLAEQELLQKSVIGIAGCGGMGGLLASIFVRLGVGEVRIADSEVFDTSNINRQFAASRGSIGKSKAFETARMTREVSDDTTIVVYPQGIQEDTVDQFLDGCDVVCDEIEFWAIGARILLHERARRKGISIFNCNTVGFGTRLFFFEPEGYTMEKLLDYSYEEAKVLQASIQAKTATKTAIDAVMKAVLKGLVPELPEYSGDTVAWSCHANVHRRLFEEGRAMIISTNPPMAAGFLADHVLFYLLRNSPVKRCLVKPVPIPGYLYFDAGFHEAKAVKREVV